MTLNSSARGFKLLIDGYDFTAACFDISNWSTSPIDQSGLVKTTCTLFLTPVYDLNKSLDDRVNTDFRVGATVVIQVANSLGVLTTHPVGRLRILSSSYDIETRKLTINAGCLISLLSFKSPVDSRTAQINIINFTSRGEIVNQLLNKAGITNIKNNYFIPYPINYFINLSGGYLQTVGSLLYSAGFCGWINKNEEFEIFPLSLVGNYSNTLTIGEDELWYRRLSSPEGAREKISVKGTAQVSQLAQFPKTTTSEKLGLTIDVNPELAEGIIVVERTTTVEDFNSITGLFTTKITTIRPYGSIIAFDPETTSGVTNLITASISIETKQYQTNVSGKLLSKITNTYRTIGESLATYVAAIEEDGGVVTGKAGLFLAEREVVNYVYDNRERPTTVTTKKYESIGSLFSNLDEDWSGYTSAPVQLALTESTTERWQFRSDRNDWIHEVSGTKCRAKLKPETIDQETATVNSKLSQLVDNEINVRETSNSGQTVPPAPERSPSLSSPQSKQVCGHAFFDQHGGNPYKERERVFNVDYLAGETTLSELDYRELIDPPCTNAQCQRMAEFEGRLLIGRAKGQDIGTEIKDFLLNEWRPLFPLRVIEVDGTERVFVIDDSNWALSTNKAYCNFGLIWLGNRAASRNVNITLTSSLPSGGSSLTVAPTTGSIPANTAIAINTTVVYTTSYTPPASTSIEISEASNAIAQGSSGSYVEPLLNLPYVPRVEAKFRGGGGVNVKAYAYAIQTTAVTDLELGAAGFLQMSANSIAWELISSQSWDKLSPELWNDIYNY